MNSANGRILKMDILLDVKNAQMNIKGNGSQIPRTEKNPENGIGRHVQNEEPILILLCGGREVRKMLKNNDNL